MVDYPAENLGEYEDDGTMVENLAAVREAVVGHRIVSVSDDVPESEQRWSRGRRSGLVITLDNGTTAILRDTDDCCAYTSLDKFLLHPEKVDHIITGVGTTEGYTKWHIYADFGDVLELDVDWSSGNPFYYGYGFDIEIVGDPIPPEVKEGLDRMAAITAEYGEDVAAIHLLTGLSPEEIAALDER